jgi:hypothetical protein
MYTLTSRNFLFATVAFIVCFGCTVVFAENNTSFPEVMKSAISEYAKKKDKEAIPLFDIDYRKSNRIIMTVSPYVAKEQAVSAEYKVIFYDCRADQSSCQSIRFETSRSATVAANICGEHWTNTFRFGRVRTDKSGMLILDMTQLIFKEIKSEDLQFTYGVWMAILGDFEKLIKPGEMCNPLIKPSAQETPVTTYGN